MTEKQNVIPLFRKGKDAEKAPPPKGPAVSTEDADSKQPAKAKDNGASFSEIMKRNAENKDRMKKERLKANQKVIRTHRLKH